MSESTTNYKLIYFDTKGRGEVIRLLFHAGGVPFEDIRVSEEEWPEIKPNMPLGCIPVLEVDGHKIGQSAAIARYVAKKVGLAGKSALEQAEVDAYVDEMYDMLMPVVAIYDEKNETFQELLKAVGLETIPIHLAKFESRLKDNKYLVGSEMTWADVTLMYFVTSVFFVDFVPDNFAEKYPGLVAHTKLIAEQPGIKEWIRNRPVTDE